MTPERAWRERGRQLAGAYHDALRVEWQIGDWWLSAPDEWRKEAEHDPTWDGPSVRLCRAAATCCKNFTDSRRRESLTFTHHQEVVSLPAQDADRLLDKAEAESLTTRELRWQVKRWKVHSRIGKIEGGTVADLHDLVRQEKRFGTIYADPAWEFRYQTVHGGSFAHYPAMPLDEICALPIRKLAAEFCHLHLWCPTALLYEAPPAVFAAWGFTYKSLLAWRKIKLRPGPGHYWRNTPELLLTAVRGNGGFLDRNLDAFVETHAGRHSEKPEEVRRRIERASPTPRLELFARKEALGWVCWGNEVGKPLSYAAD